MAETLGQLLQKKEPDEKILIINKSTVPVGTAEKTTEILKKYLPTESFTVVSNPEFLREGVALDDALKPDRIVIGTDDEYAFNTMKRLYTPFIRNGNPIYFMDTKSAELTKYAANAFLATKISFMNDLATLCEIIGADINHIRHGIGSDPRIGKMFLYPGIGYGGSCFPKDVQALAFAAQSINSPLRIVEATEKINHDQIKRFFDKITKRFEHNLKGKKIAI